MMVFRIGYKDNKSLFRKTFKEYIATCRACDSPAGDFVIGSAVGSTPVDIQ